jgi:ABC-type multidrug transport system fused ATPase/permease subunit
MPALSDIAQIFLELLKGQRPSTELLKRYGAVLVVVLTVPTVIADAVKLRSQRSAEEQKLSDKLRKKYNDRLLEVCRVVHSHLKRHPDTELASSTLESNQDDGSALKQSDGEGPELKADYIEECLNKVTNYDTASRLVVQGYLVWANVLDCEIEEAHEETASGRNVKFQDGSVLEKLVMQGKLCRSVLASFLSPVSAFWNKLWGRRLITDAEQAAVQVAYRLLGAKLQGVQQLVRSIQWKDNRHLLNLLLLAKENLPFIGASVFTSVMSGAIASTLNITMQADLVNFFTGDAVGRSGRGSSSSVVALAPPARQFTDFVRLLQDILLLQFLQLAADRVHAQMNENGSEGLCNTLYKRVYEKLLAQDMSFFEVKFKKKAQAQRMLMRGTRGLRNLINRYIQVVQRVSSITAVVLRLYTMNSRLLAIMVSGFPVQCMIQVHTNTDFVSLTLYT